MIGFRLDEGKYIFYNGKEYYSIFIGNDDSILFKKYYNYVNKKFIIYCVVLFTYFYDKGELKEEFKIILRKDKINKLLNV